MVYKSLRNAQISNISVVISVYSWVLVYNSTPFILPVTFSGVKRTYTVIETPFSAHLQMIMPMIVGKKSLCHTLRRIFITGWQFDETLIFTYLQRDDSRFSYHLGYYFYILAVISVLTYNHSAPCVPPSVSLLLYNAVWVWAAGCERKPLYDYGNGQSELRYSLVISDFNNV